MSQAVVFVAAYVLGLVINLTLGPRSKPHLCALFAVPAGVTVWVVVYFTALLFGLEPSAFSHVCLYAVLIIGAIGAMVIFRPPPRASTVSLIAWTIAITLVAVFVSAFNASRFSPDSISFVIGGDAVANGGLGPLAWSKIAHRSVFHPLMHSMADVIGLDYLFSYHAFLTASFAACFLAVLARALVRLEVRLQMAAVISLLTTVAMFSTYIVAWHSSYVHANLSSGFFLWAFVALFWCAEVEDEPGYLWMAAIMGIALSLQRLETGVIAGIFLALVLANPKLPRQVVARPVALLIVVASSWLVLIAANGESRFVSPAKSAAAVALFLGPYLLWQSQWMPGLRRNTPRLMLAGIVVGLVAAVTTAPAHMYRAGAAMFENLFLYQPMWGVTPMVLIALAVLLPLSRRVPHDRSMAFGIPIFVLFVITIVRLRGPYRIGWGDSGNRMMLHIVPLIFFYFSLRLGALFRRQRVDG